MSCSRPRHPDVLDVLVGKAHFIRDGGGEVGDAGRVAAEKRVLGLEGVHQGLERRDGDPLQLVPFSLEFGGAGGDFFLQPLVQMAVLEQGFAALERPLDGAAQIRQLNGFGEIVHGAPLHAQRGRGGVDEGGQHEDGEVGLDLEGLGDQIHAARAGHADVAQHEGQLVPAQRRQGLFTGSGRQDVELLLL